MSKVKTAVIMAAGLGSRFGNRTERIPKGFVEVNGKAMILCSIEALYRCGIERIIIGTGYHKEFYEALATKDSRIECCFSPMFATTNSMWTLRNCADVIGSEDFLLLESDLVFEDKAITSLVEDKRPDILLAASETKFQDQYFVEFDSEGYLVKCSTKRDELNVCGEFVGIHKLSSKFYKTLCSYYDTIKNEKPKYGYEYGLLDISKQIPLYVLKVDNLKWYEIDDEADLRVAEKIIYNI
ncbi:MAG: phosphocholine cytidylyltransferase family protein [Bacteroidales bacterium]|nr:phosphocholine cytidylyltransferase family protein [Bacteroidales bacterium]